ncbi:uncharacterized protein N7498_010587 [Penicillium cinerascens]|uniref:Chitin-binding type-4 domain-containing protein n=1 Tax=Penicillium cinerascens TaxID=70096 RepID=A0A9W9M923_9EURO|nr:uncharacterized protein N7498_010587 [Penicillium cinerascens]KAJ5191602.1 hypothetical protein N7498_010587 [Penicillium cinerascens]
MFVKSMLAAMLGASAVNAHMVMTNPVPYGKDTLTNAPMAADGSDFPCKLRSNTYEVTEENKIAIGESHLLTFQGSATHGGGSCQISMTTDRAPSKDTEWKVIKSFEGGCPANVDGNLSGGSTMADPYTFNFTIPEGIEAGKYTLAWTWFNRIGNREMYMNCAPVTVTGGSSKRSPEEQVSVVEKRTANFPPMFVANVNGCTTKEGVDIRFPQPGDDVEFLGEPANLAPEGSAACTGTPTFAGSGDTSSGSSSSGSSSSDSGSGSGSSGSSSGSSSAASSAPTETSSAAPAPTSSSTLAETSAPAVPESVPSSTQVAPAPSSSTSSGSSSSSGALSGPCSNEGQWNCIAGTSFQRCASGAWSAITQMAAGTTCNAGQSSELSVSASKMARRVSEMRFRKRTIGGHHA